MGTPGGGGTNHRERWRAQGWGSHSQALGDLEKKGEKAGAGWAIAGHRRTAAQRARPQAPTPALSSCPPLGSERRAGARVCTTKQKAPLLFAQPGGKLGLKITGQAGERNSSPSVPPVTEGASTGTAERSTGRGTRHRHGSRASPARCWVSQKGGSPATPQPPAGSSAGCTS